MEKPTLFSFGGASLILEAIVLLFYFLPSSITNIFNGFQIQILLVISIAAGVLAVTSMIKGEKGIFAVLGLSIAILVFLSVAGAAMLGTSIG